MPAIQYRPNYTAEDYLNWEGDWELWDGVPVSMSPSPGFPHGQAAFALAHALQTQFDGNDNCGECTIVLEVDWRVDDQTVVRPDLSLICQPVTTQFIESAPTLIAEILSPATREKDLNAKKTLYSEKGVAFYVIGDPQTKELTILRLCDDGGSYVEADGIALKLHGDCVVTIDAKKVFS